MGTFAANNIATYLGPWDVTGDVNNCALTIEWEALDSTTFGPTRTARSRVAGAESASTALSGYADFAANAQDIQAWTRLHAKSTQPITHSPDGANGSVAYFYPSQSFSYSVFGGYGELTPFALDAQGSRPGSARNLGVARGLVLTSKQAVNATGVAGAGAQMGAVGAAEYLCAVLHVFAAPTTITGVVESAATNAFSGATTRATIGPITTTGGTLITPVAGPITDTWWRFRVTAITGTATIACAAGIR